MADYTTLEFADASVIVRSTGRELARLEKLKGGVANSSTLAECTDGTRVVITVLDNHSWDSATSLCELTDFLIGAGIVTPPFLKFADSRELWDLHGRPVVVRPFLSGDQPMHLSAAQATRVGAALAGLPSFTLTEHGTPLEATPR